MMRSIAASFVAVAVCSGFLFAQGAPAPEKTEKPKAAAAAKAPAKTPAKAAVKKVTGTVENFDPATNKLTVKGSKGEVKEYDLTPEVKITKAMKDAALADLVKGEKVTVSVGGTADKPEVKGVAILAAKAQGKKPAKKAETK